MDCKPQKRPLLKKIIWLYCLLFAFLPVVIQAAPPQVVTEIIIMRHGFKELIQPPSGGVEPERMNEDNLSALGLQQALSLPSVLFPTYGEPSKIYVPNPIPPDSTNLRPMATAIPMSIAIGQNLHNPFIVGQEEDLAKELLTLKKDRIYVVWEHHHIPAIAQALEIADAPKEWADDDFESLWIIKINSDGSKTFTISKQDLTTKFPEIPFPYKELRVYKE